MFILNKETEASYRIDTVQGATLARIVGLHNDIAIQVRVNAEMLLDFLNTPMTKASLGFCCEAAKQPHLFPTEDEEADDIFRILGPARQLLGHVPDYGQGVALCVQLNRALK